RDPQNVSEITEVSSTEQFVNCSTYCATFSERSRKNSSSRYGYCVPSSCATVYDPEKMALIGQRRWKLRYLTLCVRINKGVERLEVISAEGQQHLCDSSDQ
ncbi:hypothetical protein GCK32_013057, partial [Trichostrongylus colubriformis]